MTTARTHYRPLVEAFSLTSTDGPDAALRAFFSQDAAINLVHPFNLCTGPDDLIRRFVAPLRNSFAGLHRRSDLVMAGHFEGSDWVASTGYYYGTFERDWLGIRATDRLAFLRYGEYHRIESGRAVESYIYLDLPELMIACDQYPLPLPPGYTGYLPGPVVPDGANWDAGDPTQSQRSYDIVTEMLAKLATDDEAWRLYWHPDMLWYGPASFGSYIGVERFAGFQVPFEQSFKGWGGGSLGNGRTRHFTQFGDGSYTCSGGWPSLSGVSVRPFLGAEPSGVMTYFRVCDFWRREGDLLTENWVFVDIPHAMLQFGMVLFNNADIPQ